LGFTAECFDPIIDPIPPEHVEIALGHIHWTLDRGVPAIAWDLFGGDFAVVLSRALAMALARGQYPEDGISEFRPGLAAYDAWIPEPKRHGGYGFDSGYMTASAEEAAKHYAEVASALGELHERFPFPHGGDPSESGAAETAIRLLQRAKASEKQGLRYLARMHYDL